MSVLPPSEIDSELMDEMRVSGYIRKPFNNEELVKKVKQLLA